MQFHLWMFLQKDLHPLGLVCGEVIDDYMHLPLAGLPTGQLGKEGDKLRTGVFAGRLPQHLTSLRVQRRIQGERAMPKVFKTMPLGSTGGAVLPVGSRRARFAVVPQSH